MPNHVHAILSMDTESRISTFLLAWKKTSSYRIKRFYERELTKYQALCPKNCPVWQANFYDHNLEKTEHLNTKLEYMHNNPVEAKLASTALDRAWSSSRFYEKQEDVGVTITLSY